MNSNQKEKGSEFSDEFFSENNLNFEKAVNSVSARTSKDKNNQQVNDNNLNNKSAELKECPYCAETIAAAAKKCKHCGEMLDPTLRDIQNFKHQNQHNVVHTIVQENVNGQKRKFSHFWHFVLTLLTGFWLFIWIIAYATRDKNIYY